MSKSRNLLIATALATLAAGPALAEGLGLGRAALPEEIAAWDLDISPDGTGLPEGSGDVYTGEEVFADQCAACHGDFAEGVDNWPKLAGGQDTLADKDPMKTVGSYWPHLSTAWDYVNRSMPFGAAQTLEPDEVYAIVAYILYSNDLVDDEFVLSHENFMEVVLPNAEGFIIDDRETTEAHFWNPEPCMTDCKESVEITMRAMVLDVTPEEEGEAEVVQAAAEAPAAETEATPEPEPEVVAFDPAMVEKGETVFKKCKTCHQIGAGAKNRTGPHLNGLFGRAFGGVDGFKYSKVFRAAGEEGRVWDEASLAEFLAKPRTYLKGTRMAFAGLKKDEDIEALTVYLKAAQE